MLVDLQNNAASRVDHLITVKNNRTNEVRDHTWIPEKRFLFSTLNVPFPMTLLQPQVLELKLLISLLENLNAFTIATNFLLTIIGFSILKLVWRGTTLIMLGSTRTLNSLI
jgi:hypothetical protein